MRAGGRRHYLTIQRQIASSGWNVAVSWATYAEVWGSLEPLRGEELVRAQQVNSEVSGRSGIPYLPGAAPSMRVLCRGRVYQILAVIDPEERHREMVLYWKEQVPNV